MVFLLICGKCRSELGKQVCFNEFRRFHVDNLSSAHVYLRVPDGASLDNIPANVLEECCQIVKDNSIKGKKEAKVDIVYTPWENLLKKQSMEVGQVGFKKQKRVTTVTTHKNNTIVRNLNRTKREEQPDLVGTYKTLV